MRALSESNENDEQTLKPSPITGNRWSFRISPPLTKLVEAFAVCLFATALFPLCQYADAATWPVTTSQLSPSVSFHQNYTAGDNEYVHSGIDAPASAGLQIFSPVAGRVRFAGSVPSGDSRVGEVGSDKTMLAVTVRMDDGRDVTLMPFASFDVEVGKKVVEGEVLGTLAASGDVSSPGSHIHMGLKKDGTYLDPMSLFGVGSTNKPRANGDETIASALADMPALVTEYEKARTSNAQRVENWEVELSAQPQGEPATAFSGAFPDAVEGVPENAGAISTGEVDWNAENVNSPGAEVDVFSNLGHAIEGQATAVVSAVDDIARTFDVPVALVWAVVAVVLLTVLLVLVMFVFRNICKGSVLANAQKYFLRVKGGRGNMPKIFPASR